MRQATSWTYSGKKSKSTARRTKRDKGEISVVALGLYRRGSSRKNILHGKAMMGKEKRFPQAVDVQSTLTEKIYRLRIAASEGPIRSMVQGHDESIR